MTCFESSVGVIIRQGGNGLLVQRSQGPKAGTWAFPAGHWEPGETAERTAVREVSEEVGLRLQLDQLGDPILEMRLFDQCKHGTTHHDWVVYETRVPVGVIPVRNTIETLDMRWVSLAHWAALNLEPVWRRILVETWRIA